MSQTLNANTIKAKIATFSTNKLALQKLGHEIAMDIFRHAAPASLPDCNGSANCTLALTLASEMPKSWQPMLVEWFKLYSPIRIVVKNEKVGFDPAYKALDKAKKADEWKLEDANLNPFYELVEPDTVSKTLDIDALIALIKRSPKLIEKKISEELVKPEHVVAATALKNMVEAMNFDSVKALVSTAKNDDDKTDPSLPMGENGNSCVDDETDTAGGDNLADEPLQAVA